MAVYKGQDAVEAIHGLVGTPVVVELTDDISIELVAPTLAEVKELREMMGGLKPKDKADLDILFISNEMVIKAIMICIPNITDQDAVQVFNQCGGIRGDLSKECLKLCGLGILAELLTGALDRDKEIDHDPKIT